MTQRGAQTRTGEPTSVSDSGRDKSGYRCPPRVMAQPSAASETESSATGSETLNSDVRGNGVEPLWLLFMQPSALSAKIALAMGSR